MGPYLWYPAAVVGDLRLAGDWRFYRAADDKLIGGVGVKVFLPTGDPAAYAGDGKLRMQLLSPQRKLPQLRLLAAEAAWSCCRRWLPLLCGA